MAILKYKVEVVRTDEYEIEIDDAIYTDEFIEQWSEGFFTTDADSRQEDFVKHLANGISCGDKGKFLEGFGFIKQRHVSMNAGNLFTQYGNKSKVKEEDYSPGLIVTINTYADDYETEIFKQ
jgi:hypothetical protein